MEAVLSVFSISQAVRGFEWAMPRMPDAAICVFNVHINCDFTHVMTERGVGEGCGPSFGLCYLHFRLGTGGSKWVCRSLRA